jgi:hypothetical protein
MRVGRIELWDKRLGKKLLTVHGQVWYYKKCCIINKLIQYFVHWCWDKQISQTSHKDSVRDRMLSFRPYCDIRHNLDGRLVDSTHRPRNFLLGNPKGIAWDSFLLRRVQGYCMRTVGKSNLNISKERIEPEISHLAAQCLNWLRYRSPHW